MDLVAVHTDRLRTEEHREAGAAHVEYQFWLRLRMDAILQQLGLDARTRPDLPEDPELADSSVERTGMLDWIRTTA